MVKRKALLALLILGIAGLASAQGRGRGYGGGAYPPPPAAETVSVTGNLTIVQGSIAVKSGDLTYLVPGLGRYVGFIDGLKDGARVSLEGSAITSPQDAKIKLLRATKLNIGGKDYDLARPQATTPQQTWPGFFGGRR
jgi:hypothetical protein